MPAGQCINHTDIARITNLTIGTAVAALRCTTAQGTAFITRRAVARVVATSPTRLNAHTQRVAGVAGTAYTQTAAADVGAAAHAVDGVRAA